MQLNSRMKNYKFLLFLVIMKLKTAIWKVVFLKNHHGNSKNLASVALYLLKISVRERRQASESRKCQKIIWRTVWKIILNHGYYRNFAKNEQDELVWEVEYSRSSVNNNSGFFLCICLSSFWKRELKTEWLEGLQNYFQN